MLMGFVFSSYDAVLAPDGSPANGSVSPAAGLDADVGAVGEAVPAVPPAPPIGVSRRLAADDSSPLSPGLYYPPAAISWYSIRHPVFYVASPPAPPGGYGIVPPAGTVCPSYSMTEETDR